MKIIETKYFPFKKIKYLNLFGLLFTKSRDNLTCDIVNHEKIHFEQMKETCFIAYYILWFFFLIGYLLQYWNFNLAYLSVPFELEAISNEGDSYYTQTREQCGWVQYFK